MFLIFLVQRERDTGNAKSTGCHHSKLMAPRILCPRSLSSWSCFQCTARQSTWPRKYWRMQKCIEPEPTSICTMQRTDKDVLLIQWNSIWDCSSQGVPCRKFSQPQGINYPYALICFKVDLKLHNLVQPQTAKTSSRFHVVASLSWNKVRPHRRCRGVFADTIKNPCYSFSWGGLFLL